VFFQGKCLDVRCRIDVTVMGHAAGAACPFPFCQLQVLVDPSAVRTSLAGRLEPADAKDILSMPFGLIFKHGHECAPCGIGYALGEAMILDHSLYIQVLYGNRVVVLDKLRCGKKFHRLANQFKKFSNHFCSNSCNATYNNTHKTYGTRRSKLEIWLEQQLPSLYPSLEFHFNRKDAINAELDIYIPSLKLAFELNGPLHYEPIFGPEKLAQIQNNDQRKHAACYEHGIEMCWIDVSSFSYFKPTGAVKYLHMVQSIIDIKSTAEATGLEPVHRT